MKFPKFLKILNDKLVLIGGILIVCIAILSTTEVVMRSVFGIPTAWTLNVSQYLLIWAIFLASASAFQYKSYVSVDFIRVAVSRRYSPKIGWYLAIISYLASITFIVVVGWETLKLIELSLRVGRLTLGTIQIPIVYLYAAMLLGCISMAVTVACIILDLLSGSTDYISEEESCDGI